MYKCECKGTMYCSLFLLPNEEAITRILLMHFIRTLLCYCKSSTVGFYCKNWFSEKNWNSFKLNYLRASHTHTHTHTHTHFQKEKSTFCPFRKNKSVNTRKFTESYKPTNALLYTIIY